MLTLTCGFYHDSELILLSRDSIVTIAIMNIFETIAQPYTGVNLAMELKESLHR